MAVEIERRFLVRVPDSLWADLGQGLPLRQGYVANGHPSVRVRTGEPRGPVLTCKSGTGIQRQEVETVVPPDVAEALFLAAEDRIIEKVRHRVGPWDVDRFEGPLEGLHLMEIELDRVDQDLPEPPAGIDILREVTDDKRFVSGRLARMSEKEQRKLVVRVYEEMAE